MDLIFLFSFWFGVGWDPPGGVEELPELSGRSDGVDPVFLGPRSEFSGQFFGGMKVMEVLVEFVDVSLLVEFVLRTAIARLCLIGCDLKESIWCRRWRLLSRCTSGVESGSTKGYAFLACCLQKWCPSMVVHWLDLPQPSNSHHHDYFMFSSRNLYKLSTFLCHWNPGLFSY